MTAVKLTATALATLSESGVSPALWARANYSPDGVWHGDVCGCPDSGRCANGYHHMREDDCGCLPALLTSFLRGEGIFADGVLPPVQREDGRWYVPRKLIAERCADDYDELTGVIVFGTHNPKVAQPVADKLVAAEIGSGHRAVYSGGGWWRDGFERGERRWIGDEVKGRAAVLFGRIEEVAGR
jgi:hypothetical protein